MNFLNYIIWAPNPDIFIIPGLDHPIRWYGLLFASGFLLSQQIMFWIFKKEGKPKNHVEKLTVYMVLATIIGARLGHCLFYGPFFTPNGTGYFDQPWRILFVWEGGLASHGGAVGIIIALYLFSKKYPYSFLWILDRIVIVVALTGALIRIGNFMNSEMEGKPTNADYGVIYAGYSKLLLKDERFTRLKGVKSVNFKRIKNDSLPAGKVGLAAVIEFERGISFINNEATIQNLRNKLSIQTEVYQHIDFTGNHPGYRYFEQDAKTYVEIYGIGTNRHVAQLYETAYCTLLMLILMWFWYKKRNVLPSGFNFAFLLIFLWTARFVDEFFKMNQVDFEAHMTLNMGQWLSIPLVLIGTGLMFWIFNRKNHARMAN